MENGKKGKRKSEKANKWKRYKNTRQIEALTYFPIWWLHLCEGGVARGIARLHLANVKAACVLCVCVCVCCVSNAKTNTATENNKCLRCLLAFAPFNTLQMSLELPSSE